MKITTDCIRSLNPCRYQLNKFLSQYPEFSGTMNKFLNLKEIPHADKLWVYFRLVPRELIGKVAADFAESVLHNYETVYPDDDRPRKAIKAARDSSSDAAYHAACAATDDAAVDADTADAGAAYHAAYAAAYAAARAAYSAYADNGYAAADAGAYAAYSARVDNAYDAEHETIQIAIMKKWVRGLK